MLDLVKSNETENKPKNVEEAIEAGLEYGKDYEEIVFNGCEFPTCMVSPTAVPKLISYLHIL